MSNLCITMNRLRIINRFYNCLQNVRSYHGCKLLQGRILNNSIDIFHNNSLIKSSLYSDVHKRYKHTKNKKEDSDSDDDDDGGLEEWINSDKSLNKISKVSRITVLSTRLDVIVKSGLNISRNKIEVAFYESKLRLNGKKTNKKSVNVRVDDEIDLVKGPSPDNPSNLVVSRLEILDISVRNEKIAVIVRKYKSLVIENYESPYVEKTEELS